MHFFKYQGLGNHFVVTTEALPNSTNIAALCDPLFGIGADGVLLVDPTLRRMTVFNRDGCLARMCGNGLRCAVQHLARELEPQGTMTVLTDAGSVECKWSTTTSAFMVTADLGPAQFYGPRPLAIGAHTYQGHYWSTGNGHWVTWEPPLATLEDLIHQEHAHDPVFSPTDGANLIFATAQGDGIVARIFERGVGWTSACGTGACAAASDWARIHGAALPSTVSVRLPGGTLTIEVTPEHHCVMTGPSVLIFEGDWRLP